MTDALYIFFWDVQHGHAAFVRTPNGRNLVFDLGSGDYSLGDASYSPLQHIKRTFGVERIDLLTISHPHLDHIDDILSIDDFDVRVLYRPKHLSHDDIMAGVRQGDILKFKKYLELDIKFNQPLSPDHSHNLSNPANWGGVKISHFLSNDCPRDNFNNHSCFCVLEYLGFKVVIPGDNEVASLSRLMQNETFCLAVRDADVLLAPHHGRQSAYHAPFVNLVSPSVTVVSDGRFCETSANARYSANSSGFPVMSRSSGLASQRRCLTTNSDGHVMIKVQSGSILGGPMIFIESE